MKIKNVSLDIVCGVTSTLPQTGRLEVAFAGKQELYLKQRPEELQKLVEIAKIQSTEASNAIEGIVTTSTRIRQLVEEKTTPKNRNL